MEPKIFTDVDIRRFFPSEVEELICVLKNCYNSMADLPCYQRALLLDLAIRQGTWISSAFDMAEYFIEVAYPFYYRPLMKFLINSPFSMLQRQKLYDLWIKQAWVSTAKYPFKIIDSIDGIMFKKLRQTKFIHKVINRLSQKINKGYVGRLDWQEYLKHSHPWLETKIESIQVEGQLQNVCRESFESWNHNRIPLMLIGLAIAEAKQLAKQH